MRKDSELTGSDTRTLSYIVINRMAFKLEIMRTCELWFDEVEAILKSLIGQGLVRVDHIKNADPEVDIFTPTRDGIDFAERSHGE